MNDSIKSRVHASDVFHERIPLGLTFEEGLMLCFYRSMCFCGCMNSGVMQNCFKYFWMCFSMLCTLLLIVVEIGLIDVEGWVRKHNMWILLLELSLAIGFLSPSFFCARILFLCGSVFAIVAAITPKNEKQLSIVVWAVLLSCINVFWIVYHIYVGRTPISDKAVLKLYQARFSTAMTKAQFSKFYDLGEMLEISGEEFFATKGERVQSFACVIEGSLLLYKDRNVIDKLNQHKFIATAELMGKTKRWRVDIQASCKTTYVQWTFENLRQFRRDYPVIGNALHGLIAQDVAGKMLEKFDPYQLPFPNSMQPQVVVYDQNEDGDRKNTAPGETEKLTITPGGTPGGGGGSQEWQPWQEGSKPPQPAEPLQIKEKRVRFAEPETGNEDFKRGDENRPLLINVEQRVGSGASAGAEAEPSTSANEELGEKESKEAD